MLTWNAADTYQLSMAKLKNLRSIYLNICLACHWYRTGQRKAKGSKSKYTGRRRMGFNDNGLWAHVRFSKESALGRIECARMPLTRVMVRDHHSVLHIGCILAFSTRCMMLMDFWYKCDQICHFYLLQLFFHIVLTSKQVSFYFWFHFYFARYSAQRLKTTAQLFFIVCTH